MTDAMRIGPARPLDAARMAALLHATDPYIFVALHGGDMDLVLRHLAVQWQGEDGIFSHRLAHGAWLGEHLAGIAIGFSAAEQDAQIEPHLACAREVMTEAEYEAGLEWWLTYGFLVLPAIPEDAWYLQNLAVDPEVRGRGIGAALLEHCFTEAKAAGYARLHLDVYDGNPAVDLYRRMGLEVIVETRVLPLEAEGFPVHLRMEKML